ncbi:mechanosensitive ion channel family protein [Leyella stercorea]|uniref:mechanosensitive ion channel family protein n=1 Tax=Leyella stercorea TaxID=363265 RepID=UPI0024306477|nr:mechanosensitive ion channel family protein [Leyella stercorea]
MRFFKRLACLLIMLCVSISAGAVLKEKNLNSTLSVLRAELETAFYEQRSNMARYKMYTEQQHKQMVALMQRSDQVALMLYSQKQDFTFDMTYACHEATEMYREFNKRSMPYNNIMKRMDAELTRYKYLIETLSMIPPSMKRMGQAKHGQQPPKYIMDKNGKQRKLPFMLDGQGLHDRKACLDYATALARNLQNMRNNVEKDEQHYQRMSAKLKKMNDYAIQRYNDIQHTIFVNGDQSYLEIVKNMPMQYRSAKADVNEKYDEEKVKIANGGERKVYSQWRGPIVGGLSVFVLLYMLIAGMLSNVLVRWLVPKRYRTEAFMKKKVCLILFVAMLIFAVSVMVARTFMYHNFFLMASKLLIEYAWLLCAIFFSLLVRLPGEQIKSGFRIYAPIMLMSFIVITFRIIFIPNNLVMLIFPPILLAFTVWQWRVVKRHNANIPRSDIFYTWISLAIMVFSTASALYGYVLLAVQVLIWWMFQLSCIQTITCVYDMLAQYEKRYLAHKIHSEADAEKAKKGSMLSIITVSHNKHINVTWFYDFVYMALVPMLSVFSLLLSIWWAADVFDLTATVWNIFMFNFLNVTGVVQLSIGKMVMVLSQFFLFRYINYLVKSLYHKYHKSKVVVNGKPNFTLANNIIAICCWGLYFIISIKLLKIPSTAISVISAGLATGVGFAMKDLLENFFYGISLMTGRVRVGDYIECDGIRGKVDSITYQSTQIITGDGCVIAFLNSSLFSKNFKNITRNHSYEWVKVPVGVAYGSNVEEVRQMLIKAVNNLEEKAPDGRDIIDTTRPVSVVFDEFGDNSVNLFVTYWVLVEEKFSKTGQVKEAIYNTLNEHNIEIPFPQRDVHIIAQ